MKIVRSQDLHHSIPLSRIQRTTVEYKAEDHRWIVTATCDRPLVLGRYPSEKEAIKADMDMWLSDKDCYEFPISSVVAPEERIDDRGSRRRGGS